MKDQPIPLSGNVRCQMLLDQLRDGPKSTVDLQRNLPLVHAAKQIYELRRVYGYDIRTDRLPNRVALYTLVEGNIERRGEAVAAGGFFG